MTTLNPALVIFGKYFPTNYISVGKFNVIVADKTLQKDVENIGCQFVELGTLVDPGSIHEASTFLEDLSYLTLPDDSRLSKFFKYQGFELWWIHYDSLYRYFCLPYTQYRRLLAYLKDFQNVHFYQSPYNNLFSCYLKAHGSEVHELTESKIRSPSFLPFGVFLQILITLLCIPILMLRKRRLLVYIGDKFEKSKDYDFRMGFIYQELHQRNLPFVEFIRSLESWRAILQHMFIRRRLVIYSEAVAFLGRFASVISGGRSLARRKFGSHFFSSEADLERQFKFSIATFYLPRIYDDIWAVWIMKWILRMTGIKVAFIPAAMERNFHTVLGCKLNNIPTVGIQHGLAPRYSIAYDYMPGFDGEKMLSVDIYGVWSEWWKTYYTKYSRAYKPEQLYVSGPMRPLEGVEESNITPRSQNKQVRVLFISEQNSVPDEVMPYLNELLKQSDIKLTIKFRPYRDRFEDWLLQNESRILKSEHIQIVKGEMQKAIQNTDVVVGCHSTGVLEALLQLKIPIFLYTRKFGDYYSMSESNKTHCIFAKNPEELIRQIKYARSISRELLIELRDQYFGDPYKNGSKWVVDQVFKRLEYDP